MAPVVENLKLDCDAKALGDRVKSVKSINKVDAMDKYVRVYFGQEDGGELYADYHWFWLRHNCNCRVSCRHEKTGERIIDSSEILLDVVSPVHEVQVVENASIKIAFKRMLEKETDDTAHVSVFDLDFLLQNGYSFLRKEVAKPPNDLSLVELNYKDYLVDGKFDETLHKKYLKDCLARLQKYGAIVVRQRGLDTEEIISDFLPEGAEVISTHFGRIEDLRTDNTTNKNNDQLGYTNAGVDLHTDQPFMENPPGMQALQCITPADVGGDNYVIDARHAAAYLRQENPSAFERLCKTNVRFHRKQKEFEAIQNKPIIQYNEETGEFGMVRYSYFTYAPHIVPFEFMEDWYKAYNAFAKIVRDPSNQLRFALASGDFVLYDNHRMFHARTAFSGPRHMRGVYFDSKDVIKKLSSV